MGGLHAQSTERATSSPSSGMRVDETVVEVSGQLDLPRCLVDQMVLLSRKTCLRTSEGKWIYNTERENTPQRIAILIICTGYPTMNRTT